MKCSIDARLRNNQGKVLSKKVMKKRLIASLQEQGYVINNNVISLRCGSTKDDFRSVQQHATKKIIEKNEKALRPYENKLITFIANGSDIDPNKIAPELICVRPRSEHERLFRYAATHWSIPVSSGYGRRMRFLLMDKSNGKLIGIFALGDPVFGLRDRDAWIGWDSTNRLNKLYHVLDAYILGAVPPYSQLLCGKMVALATLSNEVRKQFKKKYAKNRPLISKKKKPPILALVTTTSALGRSSIYNRIKVRGTTYWHKIGFTQGSGEFRDNFGDIDTQRAINFL